MAFGEKSRLLSPCVQRTRQWINGSCPRAGQVARWFRSVPSPPPNKPIIGCEKAIRWPMSPRRDILESYRWGHSES